MYVCMYKVIGILAHLILKQPHDTGILAFPFYTRVTETFSRSCEWHMKYRESGCHTASHDG